MAHSPPLPLIIEYDEEVYDITVEDEIDIALALEQCDRVHRIRIPMSVPNLQKLLLVAIVEECPIPEYTIVGPLTENDPVLMLAEPSSTSPSTLPRVVRLCSPNRFSIAYDYRGPYHTLSLHKTPFTDFRPTVLHQWLSSIPSWRRLRLSFRVLVLTVV